MTDPVYFTALLADLGVLPAGMRPQWLQHWRFGQVHVAVADIDGRLYCVESLPEHAYVSETLAGWTGDEPSSLAELVAVRGTTAVYTGLPGATRLVDHVISGATRSFDPATADFLVAASAQAGAALARLHEQRPDRTSTQPPPLVRYLRAALADPALGDFHRALTKADRLAAHVQVLLATEVPATGTVVTLHGSFSPDVVFVSDPGSAGPVVRCTRWAGATAGDPMYDLGTFLGPLVEVVLRIRSAGTGAADREVALRSIGREFLAGYQTTRSRTLTAPETDRLSSAVLLNLTVHYCYFVLQQESPTWTEEYVADLDRLAGRPADLLRLVVE